MKEPKSKRLVLVIGRKPALKFVLVMALLSGSVVAHGSAGYFWGYLDNGDTAWLWCGRTETIGPDVTPAHVLLARAVLVIDVTLQTAKRPRISNVVSL